MKGSHAKIFIQNGRHSPKKSAIDIAVFYGFFQPNGVAQKIYDTHYDGGLKPNPLY